MNIQQIMGITSFVFAVVLLGYAVYLTILVRHTVLKYKHFDIQDFITIVAVVYFCGIMCVVLGCVFYIHTDLILPYYP